MTITLDKTDVRSAVVRYLKDRATKYMTKAEAAKNLKAGTANDVACLALLKAALEIEQAEIK